MRLSDVNNILLLIAKNLEVTRRGLGPVARLVLLVILLAVAFFRRGRRPSPILLDTPVRARAPSPVRAAAPTASIVAVLVPVVRTTLTVAVAIAAAVPLTVAVIAPVSFPVTTTATGATRTFAVPTRGRRAAVEAPDGRRRIFCPLARRS